MYFCRKYRWYSTARGFLQFPNYPTVGNKSEWKGLKFLPYCDSTHFGGNHCNENTDINPAAIPLKAPQKPSEMYFVLLELSRKD